MESWEEKMKMEEDLLVASIYHLLGNVHFRLLCLQKVVSQIDDRRSREPDSFNMRIIADQLSDTAGTKLASISTHYLHPLLDEIRHDLPVKIQDLHENKKDEIILECMMIALNPLLEAGYLHKLHIGYHYLIVSYFPENFLGGGLPQQQIRLLAEMPINEETLRKTLVGAGKHSSLYDVFEHYEKALKLMPQQQTGKRTKKNNKLKSWLKKRSG
jgi:hypothetical protein